MVASSIDAFYMAAILNGLFADLEHCYFANFEQSGIAS